MDLDLWDCLKEGKTANIAKCHRTDLVLCSQSREGKWNKYITRALDKREYLMVIFLISQYIETIC